MHFRNKELKAMVANRYALGFLSRCAMNNDVNLKLQSYCSSTVSGFVDNRDLVASSVEALQSSSTVTGTY